MQNKITIGHKLLFIGLIVGMGYITQEHFNQHMDDRWDVLSAFGVIGVLSFCALISPNKPQET